MNTIDLARCIMQDGPSRLQFGGIRAADKLPLVTQRQPTFFIVNTDIASGKGKHWVVIFVSHIPEYFDSLGRPPKHYHKHFQHYLINHGPYYLFSNKRSQNIGTNSCGKFCLFYIFYRSRGQTLEHILSYFSTNLQDNENFINQWYNSTFAIANRHVQQ
jgi:hypothetical protein